jgi:hypothetical protein
MRQLLLIVSLCSSAALAKTDNCSPSEHLQIRQQATDVCQQKLEDLFQTRSLLCELRMVTPTYCQGRCVKKDGTNVRVTADLSSQCLGGIPSVRLRRTTIRTLRDR